MSSGEPVSTDDPLIGRLIEGRFKVLRKLAVGGMGVVYEAEQQPLGRRVALKILEILKTPGADQTFGQRFFLEANAAAKLGHPNTIVVHDYGKTDDGLYFIAMEYLKGGTLGHRIKKEGPLEPGQAIHVGLQITSSLRDAHEQGLVHRDIKPGNVMFAPRGGDPLFVKVLDFGLVKVLGDGPDDLQLTQSGVMMGSPRYMAPEQVKAQPCDARTDIYSFGAVLYHMLTGRPPFAAGNAFEAMNHHVYSAPPPLRHTWPGCTAGPMLEAVVQRCLEKEPSARFQSMDDVMNALRESAQEAGGGLSGVGSYLTASSPSSSDRDAPSPVPPRSGFGSDPGSNPQLASSGVQPSAVGPAPSMVQPAIDQSKYQRTMRFDSAPAAPSQVSGAAPIAEPVPAARSGGGGALKIAVAVGVLFFGAIISGVAAFVIPMAGDEPSETVAAVEPPPDVEPQADPAPDPVPQPAAVVPPAAPAQPAAPSQTMRLMTDPTGATVRREGSDLGDTPLELNIPAGERWTIEVSLEGYETRDVTLQGGQPSLTLHLTSDGPAPRGNRRRRRPGLRPRVRPLGPATSPTPSGRRGRRDVYAPDLDDPWAH